MTTEPSDLGPDPDMTAAELALGLLEGDERAAALRRMLADPAFAREVEGWRERLGGLFDDYREVVAPDAVAARLAAPAAPAQSRNRWPILALATALAATIALFFVMRPGPAPLPIPQIGQPHTMMVASLMMTDKSASVPAVIDMTTGEMSIPHADMAPAGKSAQLWMIGGDGVPKPMGLLAASGTSRMTLASDQRRQLTDGMTLAVSVEPVGGSPTGKPTGPVVASGKISLA
ncbi:anti-sigma factor [Sphingomonas bacterium]|uniref:anti-sigma factor n=1 Tax=Sphingomonas bacterium TaxID=1895847 RepID=UPI00260278C8|nr:anti-sigma factor [Sphingomonas bacterium]MDB5679861.1 anti-sigma factor [Sphingomonas bacterium]